MILFVLTSSVLLWGSTDARPQNRGKKIQFSPIKSIAGMSVKFSDKAAPLEGTDEFLEGLRLVMVTKDGYEYTGSLEDVASLFSTKEDKDNELHTRPLGKFRKVLEDSLEDLAEKRSVIGNDDRQLQVPDSFPYTAIGRIAIGCTGTFVAPKVVLTAGHCVHNSNSGWFSNLDVHRAKGCNPDPGTTHTWTSVFTINAWINNPLPENDIAWIVVDSDSPVTMSITALTPPATSTTIYIYGYPDDLANQCLYGTSCSLAEVQSKRLMYTCDTFNGNSGSPIYYLNSNNVHTIIGVHAYGLSGGTNSGTRITIPYYEITNIVVENNGNILAE